MRTSLKYSWPVFGSVAFQTLIVASLPTKPGWFWGRIGLFFLIDIALGFIQWLRFRSDRQLKRDLDALRQRFSLLFFR